AILFGKTTNQMNIEKALKRRGIGYQITETRSLMLDAVASDFYCLINCLLYPEDTRSFIALLKSPFCGLCEQSIEAVISGEGDVLEIDRERYGAFRVFFDNLKKEAFSLSVSGLLEKIYIEGGYKAYLSRNADSLSFAEHYDYLFSYAVQHDAEGRSLSDYARFLRNKLGSSGKLPETEVLHARKSGVQVMTVHKSKGLEFKVVIYAGVGNKGANDRASYVFSYDGDLIASEDKGIQKILEEDSREKEEAEARRLMYVAMTRAKDHLIVTGSYKTGSTADVFSWYLNAIGGDLNTLECTMDGVEMEDLSTTAKLSNKTFDQETYEPKKTEFTEFRERITRVGVTGLEKTWSENDGPIDGVNLPDFEVDSIIGQSNLNDRFGTLCHEALELLVKTGSMEDLQCHLLESEKANAMLVEQARVFARSFLESPFYEQFVKGHKTQTEVRFYSSSEELGDVVMEGVIDLLVEGEDYNLVVDYKTDRVKAPQIHKRQITTYVKVARQLYKKNCYGVLYYLRDGSLSEFWDSEGNTWKPDSRK
ncbi:MAG: PD-(D/E)XK nuclease family protein, partial [Spirochaetales bacterium]|nr:PD-(D/E)XK nuclease family protein [Spirochaetales bacterium]